MKMTKKVLAVISKMKKMRKNLEPIETLRMSMMSMKVSRSYSTKMPYVLIMTKQIFPRVGYYWTFSPWSMCSLMELLSNIHYAEWC